MSIKDIAKYRARQNGTTVEEELRWLKVRSELNYEKIFGAEPKIDKYGHKIKIKKEAKN